MMPWIPTPVGSKGDSRVGRQGGADMLRPDTILSVQELHVEFPTIGRVVHAVRGVSFEVRKGETLAIVGESGCGKSVTARAIMNMVPRPGRITRGRIVFRPTKCASDEEVELTRLGRDSKRMREIRGKEMAMVFQEPMVSFSPVHPIGSQILEAITIHDPGIGKEDAKTRAIEALSLVGIPDPRDTFGRYSFELSGGMRQRAMIAMALACRPSLLIADEPTTALDVTIQAQILELLRELRERLGMALILISHNLGVVASLAERLVVMYLGEIVEEGPSVRLFDEPRHPYTEGLLRSVPDVTRVGKGRFIAMRGNASGSAAGARGCSFYGRCDKGIKGLCDQQKPELVDLEPDRRVRCFLYSK